MLTSSLCRAVTPEMALSPNIGSDRSWVYNVAADVSDGEPKAETLAIRFANSESASRSFLITQAIANVVTLQTPTSSARLSSRRRRRTRSS